MYLNIPFRKGSEEALANEFIEMKKKRSTLKRNNLNDPDTLEKDRIIAVHYADSGAQGEAGAVEILYVTSEGVKALHGNYAYGNLNLNSVIRLLPMLKSLDSRYSLDPPYPFGGKLDIPQNWGYLYMGCMNHFFARQEVVERTGLFVKRVAENLGAWAIFEAAAWICGADFSY